MEIRLLKSKMALRGDTQTKLAEVLGITKSTLSLKLAGKRDFTQTEMNTIIERYRLGQRDAHRIFHKRGDSV
jgi:transcriptional regulator with XRE-family HTH domain